MRPHMHIIRGCKHKGGLTRVRRVLLSQMNGTCSRKSCCSGLACALDDTRKASDERSWFVVSRWQLAQEALTISSLARSRKGMQQDATRHDVCRLDTMMRRGVRLVVGEMS